MGTYRYTDSGLDNVAIKGVDFPMDDAGEECIIIRNINGLHKAIAHGIVTRRSSMNGKELQFLRTELGMTQAQLADMLHREALAVSRWERGECPIDGNAEAVVRLHANSGVETARYPGRQGGGRLVRPECGDAPDHHRRVRPLKLQIGGLRTPHQTK